MTAFKIVIFSGASARTRKRLHVDTSPTVLPGSTRAHAEKTNTKPSKPARTAVHPRARNRQLLDPPPPLRHGSTRAHAENTRPPGSTDTIGTVHPRARGKDVNQHKLVDGDCGPPARTRQRSLDTIPVTVNLRVHPRARGKESHQKRSQFCTIPVILDSRPHV